jgi:BASS family bile acid:Na+ symporter
VNVLTHIKQFLTSYLFIVLVALFFGLMFESYAVLLSPLATTFLGIIFFFTAIKIDLKHTLEYLSDKRMLLIVNLFMLILFPLIAYYFGMLVAPSIALPLLILAAMPSGMTVPLLSEIIGGKQDLALIFAVTTSLLAPITVPFILQLSIGATVPVSLLSIFISLGKIIFIPFLLAAILKEPLKHKQHIIDTISKPLSLLLLGLIIAGMVATQAELLLASINTHFAAYLVAMCIFFVITYLIGYFSIFWHPYQDRLAIAVSLTYMNITLAIYIAGTFFPESGVLIPIIIAVLPWSLSLTLFKKIAEMTHRTKQLPTE